MLAVIMAGGYGTRLGTLSTTVPKPLQPIAGTPFLEYLIWNIARQGITEMVLSVGHLAHAIQDEMGDGSRFGVRIRYVVEDKPLGTGGGLKFAVSSLNISSPFLVFNGDTLFDFPLARLIDEAHFSDVSAVMALRHVPDVQRYGSIELSPEGKVVSFSEKKSGPGNGLVNGGIYSFTPGIIDRLPKGASSLERDLLPYLAAAGKLSGCQGNGFFIDIGLPETLEAAQNLLPAWRDAVSKDATTVAEDE